MAYLIGADEAGYGPNLGPLLIAASVWRVPDQVHARDLGPLLLDALHDVAAADGGAEPRLLIGDSKRLYQSGQGWRRLETGLWPAMACAGHSPHSFREVWHALAPAALAPQADTPWFAPDDAPLPRDAAAEAVARATRVFRAGLERAGVELVALRCRAVFPREFNQQVAACGSKATFLSQATLQLVRQTLSPLPSAEPIRVLCDKHGGRNRYRELLEDLFPGVLVEVCGESNAQSVYRLSLPDHGDCPDFRAGRVADAENGTVPLACERLRRLEFRFEARSEAHLPTGLASMAAKYLRELAMHAWNEFWRQRLPDLAPTAGYPQDARRFKAAIAPLQAELGLDDEAIWRLK